MLPQPPERWWSEHSSVGCGAREVLATPGRGEVVAVYRRAVYLRLPAGIVALVAPGVPPGPLWITTASPWRPAAIDDPVTVGDGWLDVAGTHLRVGEAPTWHGLLPHPAHLRAALPVAGAVLSLAPPSALVDDPWRPALRTAETAIERGDLAGAAAVLGGLGPGLTPAGDDLLAGLLLARRALAGAAAEDDLVGVARAVITTDLSAALLAWAARGQAVEPVHDLLGALAGGDRRAAGAAVPRVAALGASSGADLLLGIRLGLELEAGRPGPPPPPDHPGG